MEGYDLPVSEGIFSFDVDDQMYSRDGSLVAVTSQEGVVRANIRGPADSNADAKL